MSESPRVAVVTGASRGLGEGLARRFAAQGTALGLCARSVPQAPVGSPSVCRSVDVTDAAAVDRFADEVVAELGPVDIWVNNAGVLDPMGPARDLDPGAIEQALLVNIGGLVHGTRAFLRTARADGDHSSLVVNISSGASRSVYQGWSIYGATKAAVDHFTEIVAAEEPRFQVRALAPGVVDTDMQARIRTHDASTFPAIDRFRELHESGAWNSPAWIADHIVELWTGEWDPAETVVRVPDEPR